MTGSRAPYFVLAGRPGTAVSDEVTVINVSGSAAGVSLYATDATTGQTSGAVYQSPQAPRGDVGAWIQLSEHHLSVPAGAGEIVPFRVVIPDGVRGGQHLGGIVAQPDQPSAHITSRRGKATFHVQVRSVAVIAVELNLPGPRTKQLAITGIRAAAEPGYQSLLIGLASTGTALTKGQGTITVTDGQGRRPIDQPFVLDTFVPETRIDYPVQVTGTALPAGNYQARITITYAGRRVTRILPLTISAKNLTQAFGSHRTAPPSVGGGSTVPVIIGGFALLLVGFTLGARARTGRPAKT